MSERATERWGKDIADLWREKRQARRRFAIGTVNLTPMLDMMFNLLIFFLVTHSFKLPEMLLAARMPKTTGLTRGAGTSIPLVPIKIYLEPAAPGRGAIIRVSTALRADATTLTIVEDFQQLYAHLDGLRETGAVTDQTPVIIAVRNETVWDQVVNCYNSVLRAEFKQIVFAGWE